MAPTLIIFDFDGTLADTTETIIWNYQQTIKTLDADTRTDSECQATIGIPLKEGFRQLYPEYSDSQLDNCVNTYRSIFYANRQHLVPKLYPGVKETLEKLTATGIRMSVASSRSNDSLVDFCKENDMMQYFDLIIGADDVAHAKPDPEPVLTTLKRLGLDAERTLVVGDMPVDIAMGNSAGCHTVGVTYGNSSRRDLIEAGADYIIVSFPELLQIIKISANGY